MTKYILKLLGILFLGIAARSQSNSRQEKIDFSGYIKDSIAKTSLQEATIQLSTSALRFTATSDSNGLFFFKGLPKGKYLLKVSFVGYNDFLKKYNFTDASVGYSETISLYSKSGTLGTVTVIATKAIIENKPDRIIYNVDKDITSQSGVATDVLRKIPQVTVDIDGNVELLGNPGVQFLINGKRSAVFGNSIADALQSIPASQIQSIEVMSSPGAKYDASGTGGIINIILKKSKLKGFSGIVNGTAGTRLESGSLNLNYKKNTIGITGYFSGTSQLKTVTLNELGRTSVDTATKNNFLLQQYGNTGFTRFGYRSGLNIDWDITAKDNISVSFSNFHLGNTNNGFSNQLNIEKNKYGIVVFSENSIRNSNTEFNNSTFEAGIEYRKKNEQRESGIIFLL